VIEVLSAAVDRAHTAGELVLSAATQVQPAWLAAGVGLHMVSQIVRIRGWWHILRAAFPSCSTLRPRDVTGAYLAGAGLNGLLPGRGGDLVKYACLHRRIPGSRYATLIGSSVPETTFEWLCGATLVAWLLALGFVPVPLVPGEIPGPDASWYVTHPITASLSTAAVVSAALALFGWVRRRSRQVVRHLGQGLAILASPRDYLLHVVTWQALGRIIRLGSLLCFLTAFTLPATPRTALLVMAAQGAGRIVPLAPLSAGLRIAVLSYGLVELTDRRVDPAAVSAFTFGVSAILFLVTFAISLTLVTRELQTLSPGIALRRARARLHAVTPIRRGCTGERRSPYACVAPRVRACSTSHRRSGRPRASAIDGLVAHDGARGRDPPRSPASCSPTVSGPRHNLAKWAASPTATPSRLADARAPRRGSGGTRRDRRR
jgi:hypothetical protein